MHREDEAGPAILKLLKINPRGLTVSDIAKKIGINRNAAAKHLEVLAAEGRVESRLYGTAKVYSIAQRVPLSAFLCFTKNLILILDEDLRVVQANDQYLKLAGLSKPDLIGRNVLKSTLPIVSAPDALAVIRTTEKEQVIADIRYQNGTTDRFYQMEAIPTTFDGGEHGLTIVLEDITERKQYVKNMEFLARTAMELVDLPPETDIYQYIAERVLALVPTAKIFVESYDEVNHQFSMRAIVNQDFREDVKRLLGQDVVGMVFRVGNLFETPFHETLDTVRGIREHVFRPPHEAAGRSLYDICFRQIPEEICEQILLQFDIGKLYGIGLTWEDQLFGIIGIFMAPGEVLEDRQAYESFVRQASIAIARRQTEDRLHRSEQRFRDVMNISPLPAALIDRDGRYTFVNKSFNETFGYRLQDIPTGKAWFAQAFPDPIQRKEAIAAWKSDLGRMNAGEVRPRTFDMRCKDGATKTIGIRPVTLGDGTQYGTDEERTAVR
ncbi:MAG: PAS domain S-box protein [Methanobacteriota archaeon]|nr:MAG: PAS domain S-box protein [Euryarchaeota archaeon]